MSYSFGQDWSAITGALPEGVPDLPPLPEGLPELPGGLPELPEGLPQLPGGAPQPPPAQFAPSAPLPPPPPGTYPTPAQPPPPSGYWPGPFPMPGTEFTGPGPGGRLPAPAPAPTMDRRMGVAPRGMRRLVQPADVAALTQPTGITDKAKAWWGQRSSLEKGAIVVGGVAVLGLLAYKLTGGGKKAYKPNLSKKTRRKLKTAKPGSTVKIGTKRYKVGKITTVKGGRSFGHKVPPKKYRTKGARRPEDYAWPAGYKYPLVFRTKTGKIKPQLSAKHTRAAARYFGKNKHFYPPAVRRTIARNINRAKKRFGVGGAPLKP